jgi:long-chain acyl-CoA synthetase
VGERIWLKHYPPGVAAEIDPDTYPSLPELIHDRALRFADNVAFSNFGARLSYRRYLQLGDSLGAWMQHALHAGKGDRVAIMLPNIMQFPVAVYGSLRAGLTVVNINPLYSPRELQHQLIDSGAETIIIEASATPALAEILHQTPIRNVIVTGVRDLVDEDPAAVCADPRLTRCIEFTLALREGAGLALRPVHVAGHDLAFLQYTGGTTGTSKGAMLTHRNLVANTLQSHTYFASSLRMGLEVYITALPLYHIFALTVNCLCCIYSGGLNVLITDPRDMPAFVKELARRPFTFITGVNTLYNGLLNTPGFSELDFSALRTSIAGGMAAQRSVAEKWRRVTGCVLLEGYGLSETSPTLAANPPGTTEFTGTIGLPVPSTEMSVRDEAGKPLPPGQPGEL